MRYFPLFHDTAAMRILVVGGGEVAARKIALWARSEAQLTVVSPTVVASIRALDGSRIECLPQRYEPQLLEGRHGVIAATNNSELNQQIAREAKALGLWVNVVDQPQLCSVITPAIVDRAPIVIAIGSEGSAPVLVRTLRAALETRLPRTLGKLAQFIGGARRKVQQSNDDSRGVWERFIAANGLGYSEQTRAHLETAQQGVAGQGQLWLMHDQQNPALLPIAAMAELQRLDRVVSATAVDPMLLELVRRDASQDQLQLAQHGDVIDWLAQGERLLLVLPKAELAQWQQRLQRSNVSWADPYYPLS
ncbi:bifunctional precorrin-2 dehydrogenase/sirohydrochlorin ferrochelatase [uncultured Ferrimonas sp.]|uniref:precorrin-2 dehydrogenase/sirohydrochlorin ferrochelatase family protein n=1 Tax=uncultured Ferrimonas sp. TaxID=432640 RepID=UPI00261EE535|nr:bifunctional precorrin-2 dehydrogenase/sirohydrochlorin ferrochelatase [uncultured Ferrimonas sp.]